jgi:hypothetical protein
MLFYNGTGNFNKKKMMYQKRLCLLFGIIILHSVIYAQCLSGDCQNGFGKYKYKNEDVYEGYFKNAYTNGKGKMFYSNGDVYDGDWVNGSWNGTGKYNWKDGRKYEGATKDGYFEGYGIFWGADSSRYDGQWKVGKKDGLGKQVYANGSSYEGNYVFGKMVVAMRVIGKKTNLMVSANAFFLILAGTKDIGLTTKKKEREKNNIIMAISMKVTLKQVKEMEWANTKVSLDGYTKEITLMENLTERES